MDQIDIVGFDLDYTIGTWRAVDAHAPSTLAVTAHSHAERTPAPPPPLPPHLRAADYNTRLQELVYNHARDYMVNTLHYPSSFKDSHFDSTFANRGE